MQKMTKIFLVRHCEAQGNTSGVLQGRSDSDISGNSARQLELVAARLKDEPFAAVYSSPLIRAYKTAQAIAAPHGLAITKDPRLIEIDMGEWEGRSWADIAKDGRDELRIWNEEPGRFAAPGGESTAQVASRMWQAVAELAGKHRGQTVCAVSHGCAIRCLLCRALGKPLDSMQQIAWSDNTGVSVVEFDGEGNCSVPVMNDSSHMPPELSVYRKNLDDSGRIREIEP